MAAVQLRVADAEDLDLLVALMQEFYAEAGYPLDPARARAAFAELLRTPMLGTSFLIGEGAAIVGYMVLTFTFSMEYGGFAAFLDDFHVRPDHRGRGVGSAALQALRDRAVSLGLRAIHLEVGRDNAAGQAVYRRTGFTDNDRQLLTLQLAAAAHESAMSGDLTGPTGRSPAAE